MTFPPDCHPGICDCVYAAQEHNSCSFGYSLFSVAKRPMHSRQSITSIKMTSRENIWSIY